ncbi:unnamed protein product [Ceratitis capitata]|uniref:(Mediterranean fruit fly) hypothetical protein n=1 Tax=Ceratitis capitata TaxID=7213 RepID=A0A811UE49_CERCA|nr:unnamed protein product [Ceratitis capitata]
METDVDNDFSSLPVPQKRRHYKKDSRFVFDLYTLCYDENESVDTVELFTSIVNNTAADNWSEKALRSLSSLTRIFRQKDVYSFAAALC